MHKKLIGLSKIEKKLKIENLERCLNCSCFNRCLELKEEVALCEKFKEVPMKKQLVIVSLEENSRLKGRKDMSLYTFC